MISPKTRSSVEDFAREATRNREASFYNATHSLRDLKNLPPCPHMAVLVEERYSEPDGYGGTASGTRIEYTYFDNEEALQEWIKKNHEKKTFKVVSVTPVGYELSVNVKVSV